MRYLARREHSSKELRQKLISKNFAQELVAEVVKEFAVLGYQSDERFATMLAATRRRQGYGALRIRQELRQHAIDGFTLPKGEEAEEHDEIKRVHQRQYAGKAPATPNDRLAQERFLRRRGFSGEEIVRLFRHLGAVGRND